MKKNYAIVILISFGITQIYAQSCFDCDNTTKAFSIGASAATGNNSFAGGNESVTTAENSFVFGDNSFVTHSGGIAFGKNANSYAANSYVFGQYLTSSGYNSITIGMGTSFLDLINDKPNSIMFGVSSQPSLTIVKPPNADLGYIGIGIKEPKEMAHVVGTLLIERTAEVASSLQFRHPNDKRDNILPAYYWDIYSDYYGLKFNTITNNTGIQTMILSRSGFVGIGVATPKAKLHVDHNILAEGKVTTLNSFILAPEHNPNSNYWEISRSDAGLKFAYDANRTLLDYLFISSTGLIGVGKTKPSANLDVNGSFKAESATLSGTLTAQSATINGNTNITGALTAQGTTINGNANITGTITGNALTINSNANISGSLTANALTAQSANINGAIAATGANINGKIKTKEVEVTLIGWGDFVFEEEYKLLPLVEVEQFIKKNKHLPNVPSAAEVEANGINLGEMNNILIQKVEELTLYILDLQKQINELKTK